MPIINLDDLHAFNPALFYEQEPETDLSIDTDGDPNKIDYYKYLKGYVSQQTEVFEALIYAQNELLPQLSTGFDRIEPEQFLLWINKIHEKAGRTVLSYFNSPAGVYATSSVFRWEQGMDIQLPIKEFISKQIKRPLNDFCTKISEHFDIDLEAFKAFITLLLRIRDDNSIILSPATMCNVDCIGPDKIARQTLSKLQLQYHTNQLSPQDKALVNQFVKICIPPDQYPAAMHTYAVDALNRLRACDTTNQENIASTVAEIFYGLVEIHPFINANGRTATILLNTLLVAMGQKSIILRNPGDSDNRHSLYSQAFQSINTSRELLTRLIISKLNSDDYSNPLSCHVAVEKSKMLNILDKILEDFGPIVVHKEMINIISTVGQRSRGLSQKDTEKQLTDYALPYLQQKFRTLQIDKITKTPATQKDFLKCKLEMITGPAYSWKFTTDKSIAKNPIAFIELDNVETQTRLASLLRQTECMSVSVAKRADNHVPVIKLEHFNLIKLLDLAPSFEITMEPSVATLAV